MMKKYTVEVKNTDTLATELVEVNAKSRTQAMDKVERKGYKYLNIRDERVVHNA